MIFKSTSFPPEASVVLVHPSVVSTLTSAVTSRARLHRFADKRHSPAHSEVHNDPVTKILYIGLYVCSNPNTFLVSRLDLRILIKLGEELS